MKIILANVNFSKHFYGRHFNTSNQIENGAINSIFQTYLVRSAKVPTIKRFEKMTLYGNKYIGVQITMI